MSPFFQQIVRLYDRLQLTINIIEDMEGLSRGYYHNTSLQVRPRVRLINGMVLRNDEDSLSGEVLLNTGANRSLPEGMQLEYERQIIIKMHLHTD